MHSGNKRKPEVNNGLNRQRKIYQSQAEKTLHLLSITALIYSQKVRGRSLNGNL